MCPNLGREGKDPEELGQCPNFYRILFLKAFLIKYGYFFVMHANVYAETFCLVQCLPIPLGLFEYIKLPLSLTIFSSWSIDEMTMLFTQFQIAYGN